MSYVKLRVLRSLCGQSAAKIDDFASITRGLTEGQDQA